MVMNSWILVKVIQNLVDYDKSDGEYELIGIVSWGYRNQCVKAQYPGVYCKMILWFHYKRFFNYIGGHLKKIL